MPAWLKNTLTKPIQEVYNAAMEHLARFVSFLFVPSECFVFNLKGKGGVDVGLIIF